MPPEFPSLKHHFARALSAGAPRLHLAAHSHHLWPDVTYDAHMQAWNDAAHMWDDKWSHILGEVLPRAQQHIAHHLNLPDPASIAFAPNTHELVLRLLSALPTQHPPRILTTDSEFHSFARQAARLAEENLVQLHTIPTAPFETFPQRFAAAASSGDHDLVFLSQVFFNSGYALPDLDALVASIPNEKTFVVIDGYHAFMAVSTDLSRIAHRAFYLAGGYKYAMAGEGACFLACPAGYAPRPRNTGWYAAFGALSDARTNEVPYAEGGARFMGATFDPSGLYRLNAAMAWLAVEHIDTTQIHARARHLQQTFIQALQEAACPALQCSQLTFPGATAPNRGNFLAYTAPAAPAWHAALHAAHIVTDLRGSTLRVGFGVYHDEDDIGPIVSKIASSVK